MTNRRTLFALRVARIAIQSLRGRPQVGIRDVAPGSGMMVEPLEPRQLLSAAALLKPNLHYLRNSSPSATSSSSVQGFTPAQISHAYGFDQVSFSHGTVAANGAGQTIAIVDAFNDPNIASDLAVFDQQFGLASANLTVVNQNGGSKLPRADPGWAGEISLDVEWAHAIAPAANILLVETNSDSTSDLVAGVDYARKAAGVSVVSMSWGGSEFVSYAGAESNNQLALDQKFTTPSGHTGVTFVVSAGDSGYANGVQWPASSPNVVSVGGTSLQTADNSGTYLSEGPWKGTRDGTSGGFSQYEPEPSYQQGAQQNGSRSTPDVGYNADPNTGFAVYDSLPDQGFSGWQVVGGTSAGAPQWAALIAIADQGRALAGMGTLDGASQTLPALYSIYSAPGTAGYTAYTDVYHDIGSDGYGFSTGLGSPHVAQVMALLGSAPSSGGTTPTPTPTPTLTPSPISATFTTGLPSAVLTGAAGSVKLRLANVSGSTFSGPVTITLYASADGALSSDDTTATTVTLSNVKLSAGGSKLFKVKFSYPAGLADGSYNLIAAVTATGTNDAVAQAVSPSSVVISTSTADLATTFASAAPITLTAGQGENVLVKITNEGNVTATGTVALNLYGSADDTLDIGDQLLAAISDRKINLKAGHSMTLHLHIVAPIGTNNLIAATTSNTQPADSNSDNDVAVIATA